ncbi:MAG: TlpA disulfide reductase family protein [Planctomycetota bacterium]
MRCICRSSSIAASVAVAVLASGVALSVGMGTSPASGAQQDGQAKFDGVFSRDMTYVGNDERGDAQWKKIQEQVGKAAPDFAVGPWQSHNSAMQGGTIKSMRGEIVVVDFWGTWCPPCRKAMPKTTAMAKKYQSKGVRVVGVCNTRGSDTMMETAEAHDGQFAMAADLEDKTKKAYGVQWWPYYVVVDRDGIVRAAGLKSDKVETVVQRLLEIQPPREG